MPFRIGLFIFAGLAAIPITVPLLAERSFAQSYGGSNDFDIVAKQHRSDCAGSKDALVTTDTFITWHSSTDPRYAEHSKLIAAEQEINKIRVRICDTKKDSYLSDQEKGLLLTYISKVNACAVGMQNSQVDGNYKSAFEFLLGESKQLAHVITIENFGANREKRADDEKEKRVVAVEIVMSAFAIGDVIDLGIEIGEGGLVARHALTKLAAEAASHGTQKVILATADPFAKVGREVRAAYDAAFSNQLPTWNVDASKCD